MVRKLIYFLMFIFSAFPILSKANVNDDTTANVNDDTTAHVTIIFSIPSPAWFCDKETGNCLNYNVGGLQTTVIGDSLIFHVAASDRRVTCYPFDIKSSGYATVSVEGEAYVPTFNVSGKVGKIGPEYDCTKEYTDALNAFESYKYNYPIDSCSVSTKAGLPFECTFNSSPKLKFKSKTIKGEANFYSKMNGVLHSDKTAEELIAACSEKPCRFEKVPTSLPGHRKIRFFKDGETTRFATADFAAPGTFENGTYGTGTFFEKNSSVKSAINPFHK